MDPVEKKEVMQTAAQKAKAAVEGAQHQVQDSLNELSQIQDKLNAIRGQHDKADPTEIQALESRLQEIQLGMTETVEAAGKEVQQATQEAKGKLGLKEQSARPPAATASPFGASEAARAPLEQSGPVPNSNPKHAQALEELEESGESTPSSARASQGIVGGFMFRPNTTSEEHEHDDDDDDEAEGPTNEDVTASIDEAQDQALKASESNRHAVETAASDVKDSLKKGN